jgi:hypothetical protein
VWRFILGAWTAVVLLMFAMLIAELGIGVLLARLLLMDTTMSVIRLLVKSASRGRGSF